MGCYNEIVIPCPKCGHINYFQSKGGDCSLSIYSIQDAPIEDIAYLVDDSSLFCDNCLALIKIKPTVKVELTCEVEEDEYD